MTGTADSLKKVNKDNLLAVFQSVLIFVCEVNKASST